MRFFILTFSLLLATLVAFAQTTHPHQHAGHRCAFDERMAALEARHPELVQQRQEYLEKIIPQILENQNLYRNQTTIHVPIVFHVIHNGVPEGTGQNISEDLIFDQLQTLNEDFQALNADFTSTPDQFADAIGNPDIQFCLAEVDPEGNPTNGIVRHQYNSVTDSNIEGVIKPSTSWDPLRYYNVWILPIPGTTSNGGTLGYAYLPFPGSVGDRSIDGSVVDYRWVGAGQATLTHETGHYLGLYHPWGPGNGSCATDDGLDDTPLQGEATSMFCTGGVYPPGPNTCGEEHMYVNYMDYASDACVTSFTNQQIAVMRATLMGTVASPSPENWASRAGLMTAAGSVAASCDAGGGGGGTGPTVYLNDAGIVEIVEPSEIYCEGDEVTPIILFQNLIGENDLTAAQIRYRLVGGGGGWTNYNWTGVLPKGATEQVTLPSFTVPGNDFTFEVRVSSPNGQPDEWDFNNEVEVDIQVNAPQPAPVVDDFETDIFNPTPSGLQVVNYDDDNYEWAYVDTVSAYGIGTGCVYFDNYNGGVIFNPNGTQDALVTPPLDFTTIANAELTFDVAYVPYSEMDVDGLEVRISTDCGGSFTERIYFKEGNDLNTTDQSSWIFPFVPMAHQWRTESIDLSTYLGNSTVSIAFINHSGFGNFLYLDNINIGSACVASLSAEAITTSCPETCDGAITLNINGFETNYTIEWSANAGVAMGTESAENLCAGDYEVTVSDDGECDLVQTITVTQPEGIELNTVASDETEIDANDGTITVTGNDPDLTYIFEWAHTDENTGELTGLEPGDYFVTVTAEGLPCPVTETITVNSFDCGAFAGEVVLLEHVSCPGENDGRVSLIASGGFAPYRYFWSDTGFPQQNRLNMFAGDYVVTVVDQRGCEDLLEITIEEPDPITLDVAITPESVMGAGDASITITPSGGTPDYTYTWDTGDDSNILTNLLPDTYNVTVTDANGCRMVETITIDAVTCEGFEVVVTTTQISCSGAADGAVSLSVGMGEAPYTYIWSNDATDAEINNLEPGTYTVEISDALGCDEVLEVTITEPDPLSISMEAQNETAVGQNDGTINATISGGTGTYTYAWDNGMNQAILSNLPPNTYTLTVTDENGCFTTESIEIAAYDCGAYAISTQVTDADCNGTAGTAAVVISEGTLPYTVLWSNGATDSQLSATAGTYTVTVTDASGCADIAQVTIAEPDPIDVEVVATPSCSDTPTGTAEIVVNNAAAPLTYLWDNSLTGASQSNLSAGMYEVSITDANGCEQVTGVQVEAYETIEIDIAVTNESIENAQDGTITPTVLGGNSPYIFEWSTGSTNESLSDLGAGTYSLTITDVNGCMAMVEAITIEAGENPCTLVAVQSSTVSVSCANGSDGSIHLDIQNGTEPYSITWDNDATGATLENLTTGAYIATIVDALGCELVETVQISEPDALVLDISFTNETIGTLADGTAVVTASGGTPPYSYLWSNESTDNGIESLAPGTYEVTVSDANECSEVASVTIAEGANPCTGFALEVQTTQVSCFGENDASITVLTTNGTAPFDFVWNTDAEGETLTDVGAGIYTVTVSDAFGCENIIEASIEEPTELEVQLTATDETEEDLNDGTISIEVTGGTMPYDYLWSNDATDGDLTNLTPGTYILTLTDANDCTITDSVEIAEGNNLCAGFGAQASIYPVSCNGGDDGQISLSINGGTAPYNYQWGSANNESSELSGLEAGTYIVTIVDANDCPFMLEMEVTQPDPLELSANVSNESILDEEDGRIELAVSGGVAPYDFEWNVPDLSGASLSGLAAASYAVTITDANNCTLTESFIIEAGEDVCAGFSATITSTNPTCHDAQDGTVMVRVSAGTAPYDYTWNNDLTGADSLENLSEGLYAVTVSDFYNCEFYVETEIIAPEALTALPVITNASFPTATDGRIEVEIDGGTAPYEVLWSDGTTGVRTNLEAGIYEGMVSDTNGCTVEIAAEVLENDPDCSGFELTFQVQSVTCNGMQDGAITIEPIGGTPPYEIEWLNALSGDVQENLAAGTYVVIVTDAVNCTTEYEVTVPEPEPLSVGFNTDSENCGLGGFAQAIVGGGMPPYDYEWSNGATGSIITNLPTGTYEVIITDANDCTTTDSVEITNNNEGTVTFDTEMSMVSCQGATDGFIMIAPTMGVPPYTFNWNTGATTSYLENLSAGTYTCFITDGEGCNYAVSEQVTEPAALSVNIDFDVLGNGAYVGICEVQGGTPPYDYEWSDGTTIVYNEGIGLGNHSITVTDANGCSTETTAVLQSTSVQGIASLVQLEVFPNPSDVTLHIQAQLSQHETIEVSLFNVLGENVYSRQITGNRLDTTIDTQTLAQGTYFLRLLTDNGFVAKKIIVAH